MTGLPPRSVPMSSAATSPSLPPSPERADGRVDTVVFDLGGVLVDWDPRYLYRTLFDDEAPTFPRALLMGLRRKEAPDEDKH